MLAVSGECRRQTTLLQRTQQRIHLGLAEYRPTKRLDVTDKADAFGDVGRHRRLESGTAAPLRLTYNDRHFRILPVGTCGPNTRPPVASLSQEVRDFTFDYLGRCRQAVLDVGGSLPEWDREADQHISDNMAALLIRDKRWVLTFDDRGEPQLRAIPSGADVFPPESLLNWIRTPFGAHRDFLPTMLQAIGERLSSSHR